MGVSRKHSSSTEASGKEKRKRRIKIGDVYESRTFAGVVVHQKIIGYYDGDKTGESYFKACLLRECDIKALKEAGVSYKGDEDPLLCEGVVYRFQIVKKINTKKAGPKNNKKKKICQK